MAWHASCCLRPPHFPVCHLALIFQANDSILSVCRSCEQLRCVDRETEAQRRDVISRWLQGWNSSPGPSESRAPQGWEQHLRPLPPVGRHRPSVVCLCHPGWWPGMRALSFECELLEAWQRAVPGDASKKFPAEASALRQQARGTWQALGLSKPLFSHLENDRNSAPPGGTVGIK